MIKFNKINKIFRRDVNEDIYEIKTIKFGDIKVTKEKIRKEGVMKTNLKRFELNKVHYPWQKRCQKRENILR